VTRLSPLVAAAAAAAVAAVAGYGGGRLAVTAAAAVPQPLLNSSKTFPRCHWKPSSEFRACLTSIRWPEISFCFLFVIRQTPLWRVFLWRSGPA